MKTFKKKYIYFFHSMKKEFLGESKSLETGKKVTKFLRKLKFCMTNVRYLTVQELKLVI